MGTKVFLTVLAIGTFLFVANFLQLAHDMRDLNHLEQIAK